MASNASVNVLYGGAALKAAAVYRWNVTTWTAPLGSSSQGPVINDAQITLEPNDLQRCHSLQFKGTGSSGSGAPSKPQSTDISITALKWVFTVLRKPTTSKRRVINAAPRKQTICRAKTPP